MLREGDRIEVFSAGASIGKGTFLRFADAGEAAPHTILVWFDEGDQSLHATDLTTLNIRRI
ncbi:hypothetical protein [Metabacillus arenae]|uniref:Uncharacterized protein n=1 Tax=Metabacillus arenae TaxID=2771434 RepID=A0A926NBS5_9BACI|nr:hypothetical protein [Metabacillus arenae]MBD1381337.1 hypothetical protein [Metabacillus arenae]